MSSCGLSVAVPAEPCYLKSIRAFYLSVLGEHFGEQADQLVIALDESCSNVIKHREADAGGGLLRVTAELLPDRVRFHIENFCGRRDVPRIKPREMKAVRPGGLGTHFVRKIMDRVDFEPDPERPGRMTLVLEKKLPDR